MLEYGLHDVPAGALPVIVTYLEMRAPAPTRSATLPDGVQFEQITPDTDRYRDLFLRVGGLDWLWSSRLEMTEAELAAILDRPTTQIYTLRMEGQDEALVELDFSAEDACELKFFGLTRAMIGKGAGRFLMNEAIRLAWDKPIKRFHLQTCTIDSPQAMEFYLRSGFTPYLRRVEINRDPRNDGSLPETSGSRVPLLKP